MFWALTCSSLKLQSVLQLTVQFLPGSAPPPPHPASVCAEHAEGRVASRLPPLWRIKQGASCSDGGVGGGGRAAIGLSKVTPGKSWHHICRRHGLS